MISDFELVFLILDGVSEAVVEDKDLVQKGLDKQIILHLKGEEAELRQVLRIPILNLAGLVYLQKLSVCLKEPEEVIDLTQNSL